MIVSVPSKELKDAGAIAKSVNLSAIKLRQAQVDDSGYDVFVDPADTSEVTLNVNYKAQLKDIVEAKVLSSLVEVEAKLVKKESCIRYFVQYQVDYALPTAPFPEELSKDMFDSFARHNGLLNCWPYIRSQISNLSNDTGFPVMLPLLKIIAQKENELPKEQK